MTSHKIFGLFGSLPPHAQLGLIYNTKSMQPPLLRLHLGKPLSHFNVQGREKLMELSLVTHVPSGPIGCAWAGHFARQK